MGILYYLPNIFLYSFLPTIETPSPALQCLFCQTVILESAASPGNLLEMQSLALSQTSWTAIFVLMRSLGD